jgi:hypothetical protein
VYFILPRSEIFGLSNYCVLFCCAVKNSGIYQQKPLKLTAFCCRAAKNFGFCKCKSNSNQPCFVVCQQKATPINCILFCRGAKDFAIWQQKQLNGDLSEVQSN